MPSQLNASVRPSALQDSERASSEPKPMPPVPVQVRDARVASVYTVTWTRLGFFLSVTTSTAMASLVPSADSASPVSMCPYGSEIGSRFSDTGWPAEFSRIRTNHRGAQAWLPFALTSACSSRTKVRSSAAAVTATTVPPAPGAEIVLSVCPVTVSRTTAYDGCVFGLPFDVTAT